MTTTIDIREHELLARYTSWKIGGPARFFADVTMADQLRAAFAWAHEHSLPVFMLGGGTNTLVRDSGFDGMVVRFRAQEIVIEPAGDPSASSGQAEGLVRIDAGAPTAGTVRRLARQGWAGLEWAEGLPGTIGGAVYGNAGCYGGDIASVLTRAWLLVDSEIEEWAAERFNFSYRTSALKQQANQPQMNADERRSVEDQQPKTILDHEQHSIGVYPRSSTVKPVVLAAEFRMTRTDPDELTARMAETSALRRSKTPSGQSCGSVFKNPPGDSAGRLIEAAGLKGTRIGGAEIAQKHANYIVNVGGATSDDVLRLTDLMRERVLKSFGVELELEVQVL